MVCERWRRNYRTTAPTEPAGKEDHLPLAAEWH